MFRWRRTDYGPRSIGTMIQVLRDELFSLDQHTCREAEDKNILCLVEGLKRARLQIETIEKFLFYCIEPKDGSE